MTAVRVADYLWQRLAELGVRDVFLVTGGGAMFLDDALRLQPDVRGVCCHHEQACAMAAEGYARVAGSPGVACVTTGPGGINALNGVFGAWTDSIPMLVVSGQVRRETCMSSYPLSGLRQLGDQEADIVSLVAPITKYAVSVHDPASIRQHLERAWHSCRSGSPGPCWLNIPLDVQAAMVEPDELQGWLDPQVAAGQAAPPPSACDEIIDRLAAAERPVLLAGTGVRLAGAVDVFRRVVTRLGIPVTTAWTHDIVASDDPHFCGRQGTIGTRAGNFTVQNADVLLIVGARLTIRQTGYDWASFAPGAFKIQVDVDPAELQRPLVRIDLPVYADARLFLEAFEQRLEQRGWASDDHAAWLAWARERRARYPAVLPHQRRTAAPINPYQFVEALFSRLADDDVVVCGNAGASIVPFQAAHLRAGQRLFSNSGSASMGYDLPAAVGAAVARGGARVVCLAGDGSLQMNVQELQTLAYHALPVKIFVLDNCGYLSIRSMQKNFFGVSYGAGPDNGVSLPDYCALAAAYGVRNERLQEPAAMAATIERILDGPGPALCQVVVDPEQGFEPRIKSRQLPDGSIVSPRLEDMFPFLPEEELLQNMPSHVDRDDSP